MRHDEDRPCGCGHEGVTYSALGLRQRSIANLRRKGLRMPKGYVKDVLAYAVEVDEEAGCYALTPEAFEYLRAKWLRRKHRRRWPPPGTLLARVLRALGVRKVPGCRCVGRQVAMDRGGWRGLAQSVLGLRRYRSVCRMFPAQQNAAQLHASGHVSAVDPACQSTRSSIAAILLTPGLAFSHAGCSGGIGTPSVRTPQPPRVGRHGGRRAPEGLLA